MTAETITPSKMLPWYQAYAQLLAWSPPTGKWSDVRHERERSLVHALPHGSGIDTDLDLSNSTPQRLVIMFGFHHMNDNGMYDGWTNHSVIVTPCLQNGFSLRITGKDRNGIKDYLADLFHSAMGELVDKFA